MLHRRNVRPVLGPISELNTTPLIDVMLVLLIMMIMLLPVATHKVPVDLPQSRADVTTPPPVDRLDMAANGELRWNGEPVSEVELQARLAAHLADRRGPVLHVAAAPEGTYDRFHRTLAIVKGSGVIRLSFVGNQPLQDF